MPDRGRETIAMTPLDGSPDLILKMPGDTVVPFVLTVAMTAGFVGLLVHLWWLAGAGAAIAAVSLVVWPWLRRSLGQVAGARHV